MDPCNWKWNTIGKQTPYILNILVYMVPPGFHPTHGHILMAYWPSLYEDTSIDTKRHSLCDGRLGWPTNIVFIEGWVGHFRYKNLLTLVAMWFLWFDNSQNKRSKIIFRILLFLMILGTVNVLKYISSTKSSFTCLIIDFCPK